MYLPPHFRQDDVGALHGLIAAARLGTLVTVAGGRPFASHVPMALDAERGPHGTLLCHLARKNDQWRAIEPDTEALVIFLGPSAYISPSFYASKREHGMVVPTFDYLAVHARGRARVIEEPEALHALVSRLTDDREGSRAEPWAVDDAPETFVANQLRGIVGLEIEIASLDGKWKLNQNYAAADVTGAIDGLSASPSAEDRAIGAAMRAAYAARASDA